MRERRDGISIHQSNRRTGNCIGEARPGYQHCEAFFFWEEGCLVLLQRVLGKLYRTVKPLSTILFVRQVYRNIRDIAVFRTCM